MAASRTFGMSLLAASIMLSSSIAFAQDHPATPPSPENSAHSDGADSAHVGKSNETTGSSQRNGSSDAAADQPEEATGVDLNGPPKRFPADDTPE